MGMWLQVAMALLVSVTDIEAAESEDRVAAGVLLGLDGRPVPQRQVRLFGTDRPSFYAMLDAPANDPRWTQTTDAQGRFAFSLPDRPPDMATHAPGRGYYFVIADPGPGDAGAASPRLRAFSEGGGWDWPDDAWGKFVRLTGQGPSLVLRLQPGIEVTGRLLSWEPPHHPLAGVTIAACSHLPVDTHTGFGGDIFVHIAVTDRNGVFLFRHVYPAPFQLTLERTADGAPLSWLKTRLGKEWIDDAVWSVDPGGRRRVRVDMMAARGTPFRYFGKVSDATGSPVAGAQVEVGLSSHAEERTWADTHNSRNVATGPDGSYELLLPTPWVNGFTVRKEKAEALQRSESMMLAPGRYDFVLKPPATPPPP